MVCLLAGVGLIADALLRGGAHASLLVVFPILTGTSWEFLAGILFLFLGFFFLPLMFERAGAEAVGVPGPLSRAAARASGGGYGGLVLVGPVPFFFGRWRAAPPWVFWVAVVLGFLALVAVVAFVFLAVSG
jgi:uncharacterized membrane protein